MKYSLKTLEYEWVGYSAIGLQGQIRVWQGVASEGLGDTSLPVYVGFYPYFDSKGDPPSSYRAGEGGGIDWRSRLRVTMGEGFEETR